MRYFLDAEFNGFGGQLISTRLRFMRYWRALNRISGSSTTWCRLAKATDLAPDMISKLTAYLKGDPEPVVTADWPEDIAHLALLMLTGPGWRMTSPRLLFELLDLPLFDSVALSRVPHNAYHDAVALRTYVLAEQ